MLLGVVAGLVGVFGIALWLDPYRADGSPRVMETHLQLGMEPCTFVRVTGKPCPACGMTTSFALLVRGDLVSSLRANWVGTLLAGFCLAFIPWGVWSAARARPLFVRSLEKGLIGVVIVLLALMMLRWAVVLALVWNDGPGLRP
jgi:hypothetical protein